MGKNYPVGKELMLWIKITQYAMDKKISVDKEFALLLKKHSMQRVNAMGKSYPVGKKLRKTCKKNGIWIIF